VWLEKLCPFSLASHLVLALLVLLSGGWSSIRAGYILLGSQLCRIPYLARFARERMERQRVCMDHFTKMALVSCLPSCHNSSDLFAKSVCPPGFNLALKPLSRLQVGSVNACRLTRHAADGGYAPRYFGIWLAVGVFRFDSESTLATHRSKCPPLGS
jgi:hypothetical protein